MKELYKLNIPDNELEYMLEVNPEIKELSVDEVKKHIDILTGELLDNRVYEGNEGDIYKTKTLQLEGYDLVESRLPTNSKGTMKVDSIEVIYYYIYI